MFNEFYFPFYFRLPKKEKRKEIRNFIQSNFISNNSIDSFIVMIKRLSYNVRFTVFRLRGHTPLHLHWRVPRPLPSYVYAQSHLEDPYSWSMTPNLLIFHTNGINKFANKKKYCLISRKNNFSIIQYDSSFLKIFQY